MTLGIMLALWGIFALVFFLGLMYWLYREPPDLDQGASLAPVSIGGGFWTQPDPPSTKPPCQYQLPAVRNFSGKGHTFFFGPSADVAARLLLEILSREKKWLGVSQQRLIAYSDHEGAFTVAAVNGANDLASSGLLRLETHEGELVYFVTPRMLAAVVAKTLHSR